MDRPWDAIHDTVTCSVCGYARGKRGVPLACCCRGWVVLLRNFLARRGEESVLRRLDPKQELKCLTP